MRAIVVVACLGLLLWVEPASAQQTPPVVYTVRVSANPTILGLSRGKLKNLLAESSRVLSSCGVTFKLDATRPVTRFQMPRNIGNAGHLEAVHRVTACGSTPNCVDVKIVHKIKFCKERDDGGIVGCAFRRPENGPKTVIIARSQTQDIRHLVLAHEFGHTTGLQHRQDDPVALMHCPIDTSTDQVTAAECKCFHAGPVLPVENRLAECRKPDPAHDCPNN